ncbi:FecR family protein [Polaribacter gangjinensis]|uniref:Iron dicitrate transport regulator FecR n=1 Tax=Polaribacter gangjinensis TaxID=574710 RepID=A0A2S7WAF7_9FLAO|nr:FecR domain-containing protein [Polaribacter gangjinensis]PQJ74608.1 hypothetical protein BTO13_04760 [Polaribacter gangjinensis]
MTSEKFQNIIIKYLNKQASVMELEALEKWLEEDATHQKYFINYVKINYLIDLNLKEFDTHLAQQKLETFIKKEKKVRKLKRTSVFISYAAAIALLLSVGYFYFNTNELTENTIEIPSEKITLTLENGNIKVLEEDGSFTIQDAKGTVLGNQKGNELVYEAKDGIEKLVYNTLKVPYGKRFAVVLSDGTKVTLNAGTSLKYPVRFLKGQNRQVFIESGEAYFDVTKDENHPFIVQNNNVNVRVLGTQFNVSAYPEDATISTVLVEGAVNLYATDVAYDVTKATLLKPGFKADWNSKLQKATIEKADIEIHTAWINGKIILKHMKFNSIIKKLERHYNVEITNNDSDLGEEFITATFDTETIDQVFDVINEIHPINYQINGNKILINKLKK